jgi:micrococcal nuclease
VLKSVIHFIVFFFLCPSLGYAISGKVVSIADGDTITILSGKSQHKIRLYGIDTPEKGQAFGNVAKKFTSKLVAGKTVDVEAYDTDKYGRTVGVVFANGVNVNQSLIIAGLAWQYQKYCKASFCGDWLRLEQKAKTSGVGLWADNDPVPPWDWRKGARNSEHKKQTASKDTAAIHRYHGNLKTHVFHSPSCSDYNCKKCVTVFDSREDAIAAGYRPCKRCKP